MDIEEVLIGQNDAPPLTPSYHGKDCLGNGEDEGVGCCCDECNYYLFCFPDWNEQ